MSLRGGNAFVPRRMALWYRGGMTKARPVSPPADSAMASLYAGADLCDAQAIVLPETASDDVVVLARAVLASRPVGVASLMAIRDGVMHRFGVKTSGEIGGAAAARKQETVGPFPLRERRAEEVVMGEDDRHLDFRTSMLLRHGSDGKRELVWISVVNCNNRLGRVYLTAVAPFHRRIVPAFLNRASRKGWPGRG